MISFFGRITIAKKIVTGFALVIILAAFSGSYSFLMMKRSQDIDEKVTKVYLPLLSNLEKYHDLILNSKKLTNSWLYNPNVIEKQELQDLHAEKSAQLQQEINSKNETARIDSVQSLISAFESTVQKQKEVMGLLQIAADYSDEEKLFTAILLFDDEIVPEIDQLSESLEKLIAALTVEVDGLVDQKLSVFASTRGVIIIFTLLAVLAGGLVSWLVTRIIVVPVNGANRMIKEMSLGKIPTFDVRTYDDEVGDMVGSIDHLRKGLRNTIAFAQSVKEGDLQSEYRMLSEDDVLGESLVEMRNNLQQVIEDTQQVLTIAGSEGNFNTRINLEQKRGAWQDLSVAINSLLTSIATPFDQLNEIVALIADGNLGQRIDGDVVGDTRKLYDNLNTALNKLASLIGEIAQMSVTVDENSNDMLISGEEMSSTTSEIATAIAQMSTGAQNQVIKVDESSRLVERILSSSGEMASLSESIYQAAKKGVVDSERGSSMLRNVTDSIQEIRSVSSETGKAMKVLSDSTKEIERVLAVITEIAAQTNLLALNAAIEAAQAGDAGRGFAVVAEEIRKLAEDSRKSAMEIESLIDEVSLNTRQTEDMMQSMSKGVEKGVEAAGEAATVFTDISGSSSETLSFSEGILRLSKEQSEDIKNVVSITESIVVIAEQTASGTEEIAASANEMESGMINYIDKSKSLNILSKELKVGLSQFQLK